MKSSISIKSWKTTISLSALLFLVFALTVLSWPFIGVSIPSSLSSPASPAYGSISYDKGANVISVTGYSSLTPCTFWDLWNASYVNAWNVVNAGFNSSYAPSDHTSQMQYAFDAKLIVGGGSTSTFFSDSNKQIVINDAAITADAQYFMRCMTGATITLGLLLDETSKSTTGGCSFFSQEATYYFYLTYSGSASKPIYLYSCVFQGPTTPADKVLIGYSRAWNCVTIGGHVSQMQADAPTSDLYNLMAIGARYAVTDFNSPAQDRITAVGCWKPLRHSGTYTPATISNVYARKSTSALMAVFVGTTAAVTINLVDVDSDVWTFTWSSANGATVYRKYSFALQVTYQNNSVIENANVSIYGSTTLIGSWLTNSTGQIPTQTLTMGCYNQSGGDAIYSYNPFILTITKDGCQTYTGNFTLSQRTNWKIALQPLSDGGLIEHVGFVPVDPGLTSPSGTYRWLDVADQAYGIGYRNSYNYSQATVELAYCTEGNKLQGLLKAGNLKPNFAYQLKLVGTPGTADNERIGLAGRWWQEEWTGTTWANGQNLNDKGDGSSPNPNDQAYLSRRYIQDSSSPTGYHYRYTGYLVFDYFITDINGTTTLQFETGSCYHVIWKTTQRSNTTNDGPVKTVTFDPAPSQPAYDTDYPSNTVSIFGEWERLPIGQVNLQPGEYNCQIVLTEESFHGSGGTLAGNWAGAVTANIMFTIY